MIVIAPDPAAPLTRLHHHWSACVGAGRAHEGLRAGWIEQLAASRDACGFRSVRFHGLFHDEMGVARLRDETLLTSWTLIDDLFDRLLAERVRPFVELGFSPADLAGGENTVFWWRGRIDMPDLTRWSELVTRFARHCLERWGADEVRSWRFEVWNEPNHHAFFRGSRSDYCALYAATARALKAVDPALRVGGPATANFVPDDRFAGEREDPTRHKNYLVEDQDSLPWTGVWIREFLDWAGREGVPVDFLSAHPYPMDWATDGRGGMKNYFRTVDALRDDLRWLRAAIADSRFPQAELHCTEWNHSSALGDPAHDEICDATYVIEANLRAINLADSVAHWTFTDIFEESGVMAPFLSGSFGMMTTRGIPKPTWHAYRLMHGLGDRLLGQGDGWIATRDGRGRHRLLAWNYPAAFRKGLPLIHHDRPAFVAAAVERGDPRPVRIDLRGLPPRAAIGVELLSRTHGSVADCWRQLGQPDPPSPAQLAWLRRAAHGTRLGCASADADGRFRWEGELPPWAVLAVTELDPQPVERHGATPPPRVQPMALD